MKRLMGWIAAAILVTSLGCSPELTREQAADRIHKHYQSIATFDSVVPVLVTQILSPDEYNRVVEYVFDYADTLFVDSMTKAITFQRTDTGWSIVDYDESTLEIVAELVAERWRADYGQVYTLASLRRTFIRAGNPAWEDFYRLPSDSLARLLEAFGSDKVQVELGGYPSHRNLVFRSVVEKTLACEVGIPGEVYADLEIPRDSRSPEQALAMIEARQLMREIVHEEQHLRCSGGPVDIDSETILEDAYAFIEEQGGVVGY